MSTYLLYKLLLDAYHSAHRWKSKKREVQKFDKNKTQNLIHLFDELLAWTYRPGKAKRFFVEADLGAGAGEHQEVSPAEGPFDEIVAETLPGGDAGFLELKNESGRGIGGELVAASSVFIITLIGVFPRPFIGIQDSRVSGSKPSGWQPIPGGRLR